MNYKTIYDIKVLDNKKNEVSLSEYKDKVLLIVNTATGCGFTPQYNDLEYLYKKYKDKGFVILDFPCNQFLNQAPGTNEEIHDFCFINFGVSFPQFDKIKVNGKEESPLYTFLKAKQPGSMSSRIKWNFTKFLVDRDGEVVKRYAPQVNPKDIEEDIIYLLAPER